MYGLDPHLFSVLNPEFCVIPRHVSPHIQICHCPEFLQQVTTKRLNFRGKGGHRRKILIGHDNYHLVLDCNHGVVQAIVTQLRM